MKIKLKARRKRGIAYFLNTQMKLCFIEDAILANNARQAYTYACYSLGGRWPEAEPIIATSSEFAWRYAQHLIQGRWLEGEPAISRNGHYAYWYAQYIIKGRFPEGERAMLRDLSVYSGIVYAVTVMKSRWPEFEHRLMDDKIYLKHYEEQVKRLEAEKDKQP